MLVKIKSIETSLSLFEVAAKNLKIQRFRQLFQQPIVAAGAVFLVSLPLLELADKVFNVVMKLGNRLKIKEPAKGIGGLLTFTAIMITGQSLFSFLTQHSLTKMQTTALTISAFLLLFSFQMYKNKLHK